MSTGPDLHADLERAWFITTPLHSEWQRTPWPLSYKHMPIRSWLDFFELGDRVTPHFDGDTCS